LNDPFNLKRPKVDPTTVRRSGLNHVNRKKAESVGSEIQHITPKQHVHRNAPTQLTSMAQAALSHAPVRAANVTAAVDSIKNEVGAWHVWHQINAI
jgi:hypothetical protein